MRRDFKKIFALLDSQSEQIAKQSEIIKSQNELIASLKGEVEETAAKVHSLSGLVYDELQSLSKRFDDLSMSVISGKVDSAKKANSGKEADFSLTELKDELLRLADLMSN